MKLSHILLIVTGLSLQQFSHAQDLSHLYLVGHYSLINTDADLLGLQDTIHLLNTPYSGQDGVFSNGNYLSVDPDSCEIISPALSALFHESFAIQLEFKMDSLEDRIMPVVILGSGWRYLGLEINFDKKWRYRTSNTIVNVAGTAAEPNKWYTLTIIHDTVSAISSFYIDDQKIGEETGSLIRALNDGYICNSNYGAGTTFEGYWRNLKIYQSEPVMSNLTGLTIEAALQVSPNPTSWGLNLNYPGFKSGKTYRAELYNSNGQLMLQEKLESAEQILHFPTSLNDGLYMLRIFGEKGELAQKKIVVNR